MLNNIYFPPDNISVAGPFFYLVSSENGISGQTHTLDTQQKKKQNLHWILSKTCSKEMLEL